MTSPMNLTQGAIYRGRVIISYPSFLVTKSKVESELRNVGFSPVKAWLDKDDVPWDWPQASRDDVSGSGETQAWIEGTWSNASGSYPSSGSKWRAVDYWQQAPSPNAPPAPEPGTDQPFCGTEGYTCPTGDAGCCAGLKCLDDSANRYGGGPRCMNPSVPVPLGTSKPKSNAVWWAVGIAAVLLVGFAIVGTGSPARPNPRARRNPSRPIGSEKWVRQLLYENGLRAANRNEPGFYVSLTNGRTGRVVRVWVQEEGGEEAAAARVRLPEPSAHLRRSELGLEPHPSESPEPLIHKIEFGEPD